MDDFEDGQYSINFHKIVESKKCLSTTRLLAARMIVNPYITVGEFLEDISQSDLKILLDCSENMANMEESEHGEDFILLAEMLAVGEGLEFASGIDEVKSRVDQFAVFLTIESLARKKMVKIYRENFSFGEDAAENIIVEKLPDTEE